MHAETSSSQLLGAKHVLGQRRCTASQVHLQDRLGLASTRLMNNSQVLGGEHVLADALS